MKLTNQSISKLLIKESKIKTNTDNGANYISKSRAQTLNKPQSDTH